MTSSDQTLPTFQEFFSRALPANGTGNTLSLGENHQASEHWQWLQQHLPELIKNHQLTTIGIESPAFFTLLFCAYKDKTLEDRLGGKEQARNYLRAVLLSTVPANTQKSMSAQADFIMEALDSGLEVIAYDGRDSWQGWQHAWSKEIQEFRQNLQQIVRNDDLSASQQTWRTNPSFLDAIAQGKPERKIPWVIDEMDWLFRQQPHYQKTLSAIESLISCGQEKIAVGRLTHDALSATLFNTMAKAEGNRITVGGVMHIDGVGDKDAQAHGTFGHHLSKIGGESSGHRVTHAILAGPVVQHMHKNRMAQAANQPKVRNHDLTALHLGSGTEETLRHNDGEPLTKLFSVDTLLPREVARKFKSSERAAFVRSHVNPLLMPDIKTAADALRAAMNPEEQGRPR